MNMKIIATLYLTLYLTLFTLSSAYATENPTDVSKMSQRFNQGMKTLNAINGAGSGEKIVQVFEDVSPDLAQYAIEYGFGDLLSRKVLAVKTQEMIIIANLAALANAKPQLKAHINAALNVGVKQEEIAEIMLLTSAYAGFPAAINGTLALKEVVMQRAKLEKTQENK